MIKHSVVTIGVVLYSLVCLVSPTSLETVLAEEISSARMTPMVSAILRARPAVVNIHSEKYEKSNLLPGEKGKKVNGMGTGIIIDERGYIVTNHHVVNGVDALRVTLDKAGTYSARVVSVDREYDLAIIKINSSRSLQVMPAGTSSDLMLGEKVIAIGNAFGYEHTITAGIISALSRDVEVNEHQSYRNLIQTDASINPGNSGGPLVNLDGEVIGINVAIRAGAQRIGFAIPIDDARKIVAKMMSIETLNDTWHGIESRDLKKGKDRKLIVTNISRNSPAEKAGLKAGDVILSAGRTDVIDRVDLERALLNQQVGESIAVKVQRKGKDETIDLKIASLPSNRNRTARSLQVASKPQTTIVRGNNQRDFHQTWERLGIRLQTTVVQTTQHNRTEKRRGMLITHIRSGSPAEQHGLRRGDVLLGLHKWVTTKESEVEYVLEHPDFKSFKPLKFWILRNNETWYGYLYF